MKAVALAIVAGVIGGASAVALKAGGFSMFLPAAALNIISFAIFFYALSGGKTVLIAPMMGATSALTTIIAGVLIFGEVLALEQAAGVLLLMVGSAVLTGPYES